METASRLTVQLLLVYLFAFAISCSPARQREMTVMIEGVNCDPQRARLIAAGTNEGSIESFDDLRRSELFRTPGGYHYFVEKEEGRDLTVELLSRTEAMRLYNELPERRLDFTQAFAD